MDERTKKNNLCGIVGDLVLCGVVANRNKWLVHQDTDFA